MQDIRIELTQNPTNLPEDESTLGFGKRFSDHMFVMDYTVEKGWFDPRIVPYAPISLYPSTMCFHYGQTTFEGLKAYRTEKMRYCFSDLSKILKDLTFLMTDFAYLSLMKNFVWRR